MNKLIPGALWMPVLLGGIVWCWAADGAPVTDVSISKSLVEDFSRTLKLSRKLLKDSRNLTHNYQLLKLPGSHLDITGSDHMFPSVTVSVASWLTLQAGDRLRLLNEALHTYPIYLEQLEKWEKKEEDDEAPNLKEMATKVRIDLRDLLHHIKQQMTSLGINPSPHLKQHSVLTHANDWHNHVQMYRALRSLERTLFRAVRDYTALTRLRG
ncbi:interleukin-27 subunit alpha [Mantella aurantiaca]